jgi:cytochrome P450 family 6
MSVFLCLVIGILALAYLWVRKRYNLWTERGFLAPKASFPFGVLKGVGSSITQAERTMDIYNKFKGKAQAVGVYYFLDPVILPIDLELMKNILVRDFSSFHDRGFYYNKEDQPVSAK